MCRGTLTQLTVLLVLWLVVVEGSQLTYKIIDCSSIINSNEYSGQVSCRFFEETDQVEVRVENPTLQPAYELKFNSRALDEILFKHPVAKIDASRNVFGSCENITLDGSASYSRDDEDLVYEWTILQGPIVSPISDVFTPKLILPYYTLLAGDFQVKLMVANSFSGLNDSSYFSFTKVDYELPHVEIIGGTKLKSVPLLIEKTVYASCFSSTSKLTFHWVQTSGNSAKYESDNNGDLVIYDFNSTSSMVYCFRLDISFDSKVTPPEHARN